jgi:hypothetical protein
MKKPRTGTHCQQVKAKSQPVGRKGLQRKSFLPPGGKKIEAESLVFGAPAPKMRTSPFLTC